MKNFIRVASKVLCLLLLLPLLTSCGGNRYGLDLSQFKGGAMRSENIQLGSTSSIATSGDYYYYFGPGMPPDKGNYAQLYEYSVKDKQAVPVKGIRTRGDFSWRNSIKNVIQSINGLQVAGKYIILTYKACDMFQKKGAEFATERDYSRICVCLRDGTGLKVLKTIKMITPKMGKTYTEKDLGNNPACDLSYFKGDIYYLKYGQGGPLCQLSLQTGNETQLASNVREYHIDSVVYFMDGKYNIWRVDSKGKKKEIIKGKGANGNFSLCGGKLYYLVYYGRKDKKGLLRQEIHRTDENGKDDQIIFRTDCMKHTFLSFIALSDSKLVTCDVYRFIRENIHKAKLVEIDRGSNGKWVENDKGYGHCYFDDYYASGENIIVPQYKNHRNSGLLLITPDGKQTLLPHSEG